MNIADRTECFVEVVTHYAETGCGEDCRASLELRLHRDQLRVGC